MLRDVGHGSGRVRAAIQQRLLQPLSRRSAWIPTSLCPLMAHSYCRSASPHFPTLHPHPTPQVLAESQVQVLVTRTGLGCLGHAFPHSLTCSCLSSLFLVTRTDSAAGLCGIAKLLSRPASLVIHALPQSFVCPTFQIHRVPSAI